MLVQSEVSACWNSSISGGVGGKQAVFKMSVSAGSVQGTAWCSLGADNQHTPLGSAGPRGGSCDTQHGAPARAFGCHMSIFCLMLCLFFPEGAWVGTPKGKHNEQETRKHVELISSSELAFSH